MTAALLCIGLALTLINVILLVKNTRTEKRLEVATDERLRLQREEADLALALAIVDVAGDEAEKRVGRNILEAVSWGNKTSERRWRNARDLLPQARARKELEGND